MLATDPATCDADALTTIAADVHRLRCWLDPVDVAVVARSAELASAGGQRSCHEADVVHQRAAVSRRCPSSTPRWRRGRCRLDMPTPSLVRRTGWTIGNAPNWPGVRPNSSSKRRRCQSTRSGARSATSPAASHATTACATRTVAITAGGAAMDGPRGHVPHPDRLDPETDARLSAVFDAAVAAERPSPTMAAPSIRSSRRVHGHGHRDGHAGARRPAELIVLCDLATLRDGLHDHSVCETYDGQPLPPDVSAAGLRRGHHPVVLGGDGQVVDVGRARRLATADQRRALRVMHRTCAGLPGALR